MTSLRRLWPLLVLGALLAGCAPAALGTSPTNPFPIASQDIATTPGGRLYVKIPYTFADFGIDPTKLTGMLWVPSGYNSETAVVTSTFSLTNVQVPEGWRMTVAQVQATRVHLAPLRSIDKGSTQYSLMVVLEIHAKPEAVSGPYHLSASMSYKTTSKAIHVDLRVMR
jgi:hypothetical protein